MLDFGFYISTAPNRFSNTILYIPVFSHVVFSVFFSQGTEREKRTAEMFMGRNRGDFICLYFLFQNDASICSVCPFALLGHLLLFISQENQLANVRLLLVGNNTERRLITMRLFGMESSIPLSIRD